MSRVNGFTLIELVVALAAASALILVLASVTTGTVDRMRKVKGSPPITDELAAAKVLERLVERAVSDPDVQSQCSPSEVMFAAARPLSMGEGSTVVAAVMIREIGQGFELATSVRDAEEAPRDLALPLRFDRAMFECRWAGQSSGVRRLASITLRLQRERSSLENGYRFTFPVDNSLGGQQGAFSSL